PAPPPPPSRPVTPPPRPPPPPHRLIVARRVVQRPAAGPPFPAAVSFPLPAEGLPPAGRRVERRRTRLLRADRPGPGVLRPRPFRAARLAPAGLGGVRRAGGIPGT